LSPLLLLDQSHTVGGKQKRQILEEDIPLLDVVGGTTGSCRGLHEVAGLDCRPFCSVAIEVEVVEARWRRRRRSARRARPSLGNRDLQ